MPLISATAIAKEVILRDNWLVMGIGEFDLIQGNPARYPAQASPQLIVSKIATIKQTMHVS